MQFCQSGCKLQSINKTSEYAECLCPPNNGFTNISITNIEEIVNDNNNNNNNNNDNNSPDSNNDYNNKYQKYSAVNSKILKCAKNISTDFHKNYILIIFTFLLIGYISLSVIFLVFKKKFWEKMLDDKKEKEEIKEKPKASPPNPKGNIKSQTVDITNLKENPESKEKIKPNTNTSTNIIKPIEPDMLDFTQAKDEEKRSFLSMLISSLKKRELIIFSFIKDQNIEILKKLLLILAFINYFATNTFFFTEKNIHQIYLDKGKYNFGYQIKYIIGAAFISSIFLYIAKYFSTIRKPCNEKNVNSLDKKIWILLAVSNGLFIFYWVYIGSLTSTYINASKHLLFNTLITFLFCCVLDCVLALTSALLRKISLDKSKQTLYSISKIINFL